MYVNITYRWGEVSNKASKFDGIHTKSYCVYDWLAGGEGCMVVVWNAALSGITLLPCNPRHQPTSPIHNMT